MEPSTEHTSTDSLMLIDIQFHLHSRSPRRAVLTKHAAIELIGTRLREQGIPLLHSTFVAIAMDGGHFHVNGVLVLGRMNPLLYEGVQQKLYVALDELCDNRRPMRRLRSYATASSTQSYEITLPKQGSWSRDVLAVILLASATEDGRADAGRVATLLLASTD